MTRKRTTRAQNKRAKPKLKDGEVSGADSLTAKDKKEKLETFVKDFDTQVENIKLKYDKEQKLLATKIDHIFYQFLTRLSPAEKKMRLCDFIAENEPSAVDKSRDTQRVQIEALQTKYKTRTRRVCEPIPEGGGEGPATVTKTTRKGKTGVTFTEPPLSSHRLKYTTPALQRSAMACGFETPLITPKFDPRLPPTPADMRGAMQGEVLLSLAGSPVDPNKASRPKNNRTIQLTIPEGVDYDKVLDDLTIPDNTEINTGSGADLKRIMAALSAVLQKGERADK